MIPHLCLHMYRLCTYVSSLGPLGEGLLTISSLVLPNLNRFLLKETKKKKKFSVPYFIFQWALKAHVKKWLKRQFWRKMGEELGDWDWHIYSIDVHARWLQPCLTLYDPWWTVAHQAPLSMGFPRQEYWVGCHSLLQGIIPTQESNWCLLHW